MEIRIRSHEGDDTDLEAYLGRLSRRIGALEVFTSSLKTGGQPIKPSELKEPGYYFAEYFDAKRNFKVDLVRYAPDDAHFQSNVWWLSGVTWKKPEFFEAFYGPIKPEHYGAPTV
jgi:hypothetical protein